MIRLRRAAPGPSSHAVVNPMWQSADSQFWAGFLCNLLCVLNFAFQRSVRPLRLVPSGFMKSNMTAIGSALNVTEIASGWSLAADTIGPSATYRFECRRRHRIATWITTAPNKPPAIFSRASRMCHLGPPSLFEGIQVKVPPEALSSRWTLVDLDRRKRAMPQMPRRRIDVRLSHRYACSDGQAMVPVYSRARRAARPAPASRQLAPRQTPRFRELSISAQAAFRVTGRSRFYSASLPNMEATADAE